MNALSNSGLGPTRPHRRQRGAATLIVVMLLFFVISMVAAYTSRNLIFEQRTSANQYRSTQAFEAADAGLEWALAQLNAGRMTSTCASSDTSSTDPTVDRSFASRYILSIDGVTGAVTPRTPPILFPRSVIPRCVFNASNTNPANWGWSCTCPTPGATSTNPAAPGGTAPAPAFAVRLLPLPPAAARPDLVMLESHSCTRLDINCIDPASSIATRANSGDGVAVNTVMLALRGALTRPPGAALSVAGVLAVPTSGPVLALANTVSAAGGITLHTGGTPSPAVPHAAVTLTGSPGTPAASTMISGDASLTHFPPALTVVRSPDDLFALYFGVRPTVYFNQPGIVNVACASGCDADDLNLAMLRNPNRAIRVTGGGLLTLDAPVGTATVPALLIVEGDVTFASGGALVGLIYGRKAAWIWTVNANATLQGAAIAETDLAVAGTGAGITIGYNPDVLTALRVSYGSFVRVPGSWKDFQ